MAKATLPLEFITLTDQKVFLMISLVENGLAKRRGQVRLNAVNFPEFAEGEELLHRRV